MESFEQLRFLLVLIMFIMTCHYICRPSQPITFSDSEEEAEMIPEEAQPNADPVNVPEVIVIEDDSPSVRQEPESVPMSEPIESKEVLVKEERKEIGTEEMIAPSENSEKAQEMEVEVIDVDSSSSEEDPEDEEYDPSRERLRKRKRRQIAKKGKKGGRRNGVNQAEPEAISIDQESEPRANQWYACKQSFNFFQFKAIPDFVFLFFVFDCWSKLLHCVAIIIERRRKVRVKVLIMSDFD